MNPNPIDDMEYQFSKLQEDCIEQQLKIKQLEFDCEDFIKAAKIALEDRDKQVMKVRRLEEYIEKLENEIKGYIGQHDSSDR